MLAKRMLNSLYMKDNFFLESYIKGVIAFPVGVSYIAYDFIDSENRAANFDDRVRIATMLKNGISLRRAIEKIINIVANDFASYIDIDRVKKRNSNCR